MTVLFLGLMLANFVCLIGTAVAGYGGVMHWHRVFGALAAMVCCGVHCVVFTYFIATGKWIEQAILVKKLDPGIAAPTRPLRNRAFAAALSVIVVAIATAIVGAAVDNQYLSPAWHHVMAVVLLAGNVGAGVVEYRCIGDNGMIIGGILKRING
jgi:hypothetical protein